MSRSEARPRGSGGVASVSGSGVEWASPLTVDEDPSITRSAYHVSQAYRPKQGVLPLTAEADQLVLDYLGKVADLAQGRMSPQSRARLIERLRQDISKRVTERNAEKPGDIRQILLGLGTAEALVTVEANKDPLYRARQAERLRSGFGAASVFSPEVDPQVAALVTPESLTNPVLRPVRRARRLRVAAPRSGVPFGPRPVRRRRRRVGGTGRHLGDAVGLLRRPADPSGGQPPELSAGFGARGALRRSGRNRAVICRFSQSAAQNHTQASIAIAVLALGAAMNAVASSPYAVGRRLIGYLLGMTSYSVFARREAGLRDIRSAHRGDPVLRLRPVPGRGRSTGHDQPVLTRS